MQYIDKHNQETFFTIDTAPEKLKKKRTLLEYFHNYMSENLLKVCFKTMAYNILTLQQPRSVIKYNNTILI